MNAQDSIKGKVVVITGASSGIGEATALALAGSGATVALIARRGDRLDELRDRIASSGGTAAAVVADIADRKQAETAVQRVVTELGRLDIVVNNAGLMYVTRASLPHLIRAAADAPRRVADVVSISSTAAGWPAQETPSTR